MKQLKGEIEVEQLGRVQDSSFWPKSTGHSRLAFSPLNTLARIVTPSGAEKEEKR
jgi:hypothetical protein